MKKIYLLLPLLTGCINTLVNQNPTEKNKVEDKVINESCMDFSKVKVLQVTPDGYALAEECEDTDTRYCFGATVLLSPQRNVDYYDDMFVSIPKDRCFVQNGVYKYETKGGFNKTVPVLARGYKYEAKSEEEIKQRAEDHKEYIRFMCKNGLKYNKNDTKTNLAKCDCISNNFIELSVSIEQELGDDKTNFENVFKDRIEKKCGDLSDIKW